MTDRPRFTQVKGNPEEAHNNYHGAPLVNFFLWLLDGWAKRRTSTDLLQGENSRFHSMEVPPKRTAL